VVAKASRNEMRGASVPYVLASLIQRIYPFTREKIPSLSTNLFQLSVNTVKVFLTNLRKWKVFFSLIMVPVHLSFALMCGKLFSVTQYKH